jgi:hypothetical protein
MCKKMLFSSARLRKLGLSVSTVVLYTASNLNPWTFRVVAGPIVTLPTLPSGTAPSPPDNDYYYDPGDQAHNPGMSQLAVGYDVGLSIPPEKVVPSKLNADRPRNHTPCLLTSLAQAI